MLNKFLLFLVKYKLIKNKISFSNGMLDSLLKTPTVGEKFEIENSGLKKVKFSKLMQYTKFPSNPLFNIVPMEITGIKLKLTFLFFNLTKCSLKS